MISQAIILAGGKGTRLGDLTKRIAKPLLKVGDKPFLEYLIWNLVRHGVNDIIITTGYLGEQFVLLEESANRFGCTIRCFQEESPLGTGGCLKAIEGNLKDAFFVLNGDSIFEVNYRDLACSLERNTSVLATLTLRELTDASRFGNVLFSGGLITSFQEKKTSEDGVTLINGGVYVMRKEILNLIPKQKFSLERDLFPTLAESKQLGGILNDGFFLDIGVPESYQAAQTLIPNWQTRKAVFFDRDGVLNFDFGYVHKKEDFKWISEAKDVVKFCNDSGWLVFIVTNQAGIARGHYSETEFMNLMEWVSDELAEHGAHIDKVYYCPHHPTAGLGKLKKKCGCRKPEPGMIEQALSEWPVDKASSILIGDKKSDVDAANASGIKGILFDKTKHSLLQLLMDRETG